jgi:hypothetical protein
MTGVNLLKTFSFRAEIKIKTIKKFTGYGNGLTVMGYAHVLNKLWLSVKSPLDE